MKTFLITLARTYVFQTDSEDITAESIRHTSLTDLEFDVPDRLLWDDVKAVELHGAEERRALEYVGIE